MRRRSATASRGSLMPRSSHAPWTLPSARSQRRLRRVHAFFHSPGRSSSIRAARAASFPCSTPKLKPFSPPEWASAPSSRSAPRATTVSWCSPSADWKPLSDFANRLASLPTAGPATSVA